MMTEKAVDERDPDTGGGGWFGDDPNKLQVIPQIQVPASMIVFFPLSRVPSARLDNFHDRDCMSLHHIITAFFGFW